MANKQSIYRDPAVQEVVNYWFNKSDVKNYPLASLFWFYTRWVTNDKEPDAMKAIMSYEDFARCLYAIGVVDIQEDVEGAYSWKQLEDWRPSLDQIKRLKV